MVVGAGAAGMMAAGRAAESGHTVDIYEKNNIVGKKIRITGKGTMQCHKCFGPGGAYSQYTRKSVFYVFSPLQIYTADTGGFNGEALALRQRSKEEKEYFP